MPPRRPAARGGPSGRDSACGRAWWIPVSDDRAEVTVERARAEALRGDGAARSAFRGFTVLGQMREFGGAFGHTRIVRTDDGGPIVIAIYSSRDRFENGDAQIEIELVKAAEGWKILRFGVAPVLAPMYRAARG